MLEKRFTRGPALYTLWLVTTLSVVGAVHAEAPQTAAPIVTIATGQVRGAVQDGIYLFKGIHYAGNSGGANRFKPPVPPASWTGVRDAVAYGDQCPQMPPTGGVDKPDDGSTPTSEDCLVLNVWTPGVHDGKRRPVMVWLHGGGYVVGSGAAPATDGTHLARQGDTVIVTLNHRLNVLGYLFLGAAAGPEFADSGNVGQLDLVAALHWVHDNIAQFGGDPGQVTIFGESGGGGKVSTLLAMPQAEGLFQRAIMQSGFGLQAITPQEANKTTESLLSILKLRRDQVKRLQALPVKNLQDALRIVTGGTPLGVGPVLDGRSVPRHPFSPDAPGVSAGVPIIAGWNKDETTILFPPPDAFDLDWAGLRRHLAIEMAGTDVDALIARLRVLRPKATPSDLYFTVTTELGMGAGARTVATRKAERGGAPAYLYRLEFESKANGGRLRAHHGLDVALVFNNVTAATTVGDAVVEAQQVADAMSAAWLRFARTGNPNGPGLAYWPAFDPQLQPTMVFNALSRAISDPIRDLRLLLKRPLESQWQMPGGTGDQQRHYYFAAAQQEMPYRLYVPESYDPSRKYPLVVALHGYGGNQDYFFNSVHDLRALSDKHGFILVAPMGYSISGWYGAPLSVPGSTPRANVPQVPLKPVAEERRERDLSEADVMNVLAIVRKEYSIDPSRIYLMGHSMGGMGAWYLGQKYADIWAAIAPMSGTLDGVDYSLDRLRNIPVMLSVGSTETATVAACKSEIASMQAFGMKPVYLEIEGATHGSMIAPALPAVFEFFAHQQRSPQP
jgi:para-nitrobenzyl esterase